MTPAVVFQGVGKTYTTSGGRPVHALTRVDLQIQPGDFFGLLGPNGAGKTTLIQIMAGLVRPSTGRAEVMGHDVLTDSVAARRCLGVVPQELVFDPFFTVRETLEIQSGFFGIADNRLWIDELLHALGLEDKAATNMRALSGGMKRRVLVAQALVHRPAVIVLDEPTAGVDIQLRESLWRFVKSLNEQGHTIILTTHYLEEAESLCRHIGFLKGGELVAVSDTQSLLSGASALEGRSRLEQVFRRIFETEDTDLK